MLFRSFSLLSAAALTGAALFAQTGAPGSPLYAFDELLKAASAAGVQEKDITRAILEGRIHPKLEDLKLAEMNVGGGRGWNARFGSMGSLATVKTIFQGKPATLTGKDLLAKIFMTRGASFQTYVGKPPDLSLTYAQTVAFVKKTKPDLVSWVEGQMPIIDAELSVATYFAGDRSTQIPGFQSDYEALGSAPPPATPLVSSTRPVSPKPSTPLAASTVAGTAPGGAVKACDDLAAHPDDKGKTSAGVMDEKINAVLAIERCSSAAQQEPQSGRLHFQLGRAYWKAEKYDEALEAFLKAEELEYAPAYFYIGMAYEDGLIEGEKADLAMARDMYMIAASEGFEPAVRAFEDFEEAWEVDFKKDFTNPAFAQAIYEDKFEFYEAYKGPGKEKLEQREKFLVYLRGVHDYLKETPASEDAACPAMVSNEVSQDLDGIFRVNNGMPFRPGKNFMEEMQAMQRASSRGKNPSLGGALEEAFDVIGRRGPAIQIYRQAGVDDMYAITAYGGCAGPPAQRFYANIAEWITKAAARLR